MVCTTFWSQNIVVLHKGELCSICGYIREIFFGGQQKMLLLISSGTIVGLEWFIRPTFINLGIKVFDFFNHDLDELRPTVNNVENFDPIVAENARKNDTLWFPFFAIIWCWLISGSFALFLLFPACFRFFVLRKGYDVFVSHSRVLSCQ